MNWKDILKENRLISQNVTHTKVDENKPEQSDDRCKEALKKIVRQLENFYSYGDNPQRLLVQSSISGNRPDELKRFYDAQAFSFLIEQIDSCPEEICCDILEQFKRLEQEGNNWLNNLQNAIIEDEFQAGVDNFDFQYTHHYSAYEGENKVKLGTMFEEQYTEIIERKSSHPIQYGLLLAIRLNYNEKSVVFHLRYDTGSFLREELRDFRDTPMIAIQNVAYGVVEDIIRTIGPGAGMI